MALTQDGWFNDTYIKMATNTIAINLGDTTPGTYKGALWTSAGTPDFSQTNPAYGTAPLNSGETSGPGYTAAGSNLTVTAFGELAGQENKIGWTFSSVTWATSTISAAGLLIYCPGLSNRAVLLRYFGQTYTTADGDFQIVFNASGVWANVLRNTA